MRKSTILGLFAALMFANSCTDDNGLSQRDSNLSQVSFKVSADGALTRAISDGSGVDKLVYRVFDKSGAPITNLAKTEVSATDLLTGHVVTLTLAKGQT